MLKRFPEADIKNLMADCCPCNFGVRTVGTEIVDIIGNCFIECKACWNSEVIGNNELCMIKVFDTKLNDTSKLFCSIKTSLPQAE